MGYSKWIFFDIGSTLVDESECYEARYKETTAGTDVSYQEFKDKVIEFAATYDNPYKEAKYHTVRISNNGKRKRYYPFLKPTPEYERIKTKWAEEKQSGQENQKPTEPNTKQNKTYELYYEEVENTPNQPKQKTLI